MKYRIEYRITWEWHKEFPKFHYLHRQFDSTVSTREDTTVPYEAVNRKIKLIYTVSQVTVSVNKRCMRKPQLRPTTAWHPMIHLAVYLPLSTIFSSTLYRGVCIAHFLLLQDSYGSLISTMAQSLKNTDTQHQQVACLLSCLHKVHILRIIYT